MFSSRKGAKLPCLCTISGRWAGNCSWDHMALYPHFACPGSKEPYVIHPALEERRYLGWKMTSQVPWTMCWLCRLRQPAALCPQANHRLPHTRGGQAHSTASVTAATDLGTAMSEEICLLPSYRCETPHREDEQPGRDTDDLCCCLRWFSCMGLKLGTMEMSAVRTSPSITSMGATAVPQCNKHIVSYDH